MFDLSIIKLINNRAVEKHQSKISRAESLRKRLKGKIAAKKLASFSNEDLENAAYYLL
jgi:hypothetical protein